MDCKPALCKLLSLCVMRQQSSAVPNEIRVSIDWTCPPHQLQRGTWWDFGEVDTILSESQVFSVAGT